MKIKELGKCLDKAADYEDSKAAECYAEHKQSGMEESHAGRMGDLHKGSAANLRECAAKCMKADEADDLSKAASEDFVARLEKLENTIVPSGVSKVTPNAPRAVPRFGSAPMQRPAVPLAFEHLSRIEE